MEAKAAIHNWEEDMVTRRDLGKIGLAAGFAGTFTRPAWAESAADIAVKAAQQYKGQTITIVWEAGLQSLDPLNFSGPQVGGAHRHQGQGGRGSGGRDVHQDHAGLPVGRRRL